MGFLASTQILDTFLALHAQLVVLQNARKVCRAPEQRVLQVARSMLQLRTAQHAEVEVAEPKHIGTLAG